MNSMYWGKVAMKINVISGQRPQYHSYAKWLRYDIRDYHIKLLHFFVSLK